MDYRKLTENALKERAAKLPEGWTMILSPPPSELPPDLKKFEPDAIARSGDKAIVFEIVIGRRAASSAAKVAQIQRIRDAIERTPGWELELIVAPDPGPSLADEPSIQARLDTALRVAEISPEGAFMLAFSVLEWKLAQWSESLGTDYQPLAGRMAANLATEGTLPEIDYRRIAEYQRRRNIIAHAGQKDFTMDTSYVEEFIDFVKQLDSRITDYSGLTRR